MKKVIQKQSSSPSSALHKLFAKQSKKVSNSTRKANLLKTFADDDHRKIAQLIQRWLNEDSTKG